MLSSTLPRGALAPRAHRAARPVVVRPAWPPATGRCRAVRSGPRSARLVIGRAAETREGQAAIENLSTDYCDDFVCTSSPAVEQTVRSLARDLARCAYTARLFQPDATFDDGYRAFKGAERVARSMWARDVLRDPKVTVTKMRMADKGTAEISWTLTGSVAVFPVTLGVTTAVTLNLLTGRITNLKEVADASRLAPPAAAALAAARVSWAAQQKSQDAREGITKALDSLSSMASVDEDTVYRDPSDPTKFFKQEDSTFNDAIALCLLLAILYAAYKAYATVLGA